MASKKRGLTLAILGLKPKGNGAASADETDAMPNGDDGGGGDDLPLGLVDAIAEFASAESDDDKARAFYNAVQLCKE